MAEPQLGCPCHGPTGRCLIGRQQQLPPTTAQPCGPPAAPPAGPLAAEVLSEFEKHCERTRAAARARREAVAFKSIVEDGEDRDEIDIMDTLGKRQPSDKYDGDVNVRTLRTLLTIIDESGWERCTLPRTLSAMHQIPLLTVWSAVVQFCAPDAVPLGIRALRLARAVQVGVGDGAAGDHEAQRVGQVQLGGDDQAP